MRWDSRTSLPLHTSCLTLGPWLSQKESFLARSARPKVQLVWCATSAPTFRFTSQPNFQKKSCSSRKRFGLVWCGRRDLNSRTIFVMVSRVVGLEAHWTSPCYVLDQARLRPHRPRVYPWVHLSYDSEPRHVSTDSSEQGFRREPKTAASQCCQYPLTRAAGHAVFQSF